MGVCCPRSSEGASGSCVSARMSSRDLIFLCVVCFPVQWSQQWPRRLRPPHTVSPVQAAAARTDARGHTHTRLATQPRSLSHPDAFDCVAPASTRTAVAAAAGYVLSAPATPATPGLTQHSATLSPSMPRSLGSLAPQQSRLELEAAHLSAQYDRMLHTLSDSQSQVSGMTVHYVASLQSAVKSSSSSVGILIETHTALIRKMLIAVQQTAGIEELEQSIAATRVALTELEMGVASLINDDALQSTRAQLQLELQEDGAHNRLTHETGDELAEDEPQQHQIQPPIVAAPPTAASRNRTPPPEPEAL